MSIVDTLCDIAFGCDMHDICLSQYIYTMIYTDGGCVLSAFCVAALY